MLEAVKFSGPTRRSAILTGYIVSQRESPIPYDENPTEIQKRIELSVTNGRGYLPVQASLDLVNKTGEPKLSLEDVNALIPIYHDQQELFNSDLYENPCGEVALGEAVACICLFPSFKSKPLTVLEEVRQIQKTKARIAWEEEKRRNGWI